MQLKNQYSITSSGKNIIAYNQVTNNFAQALNGGQNVLSHLYLFCDNGNIIKEPLKVVCGSVKQSFLILNAQINASAVVNEVGCGSQNEIISRAQLDNVFEISQSAQVTLIINFDLMQDGQILHTDFFRLITGTEFNISAINLSLEKLEQVLTARDFLDRESVNKSIINGAVCYKMDKSSNQQYCLFFANSTPIYVQNYQKQRIIQQTTINSQGFIVDDNCKYVTDQSPTNATVVGYGNFIASPRRVSFVSMPYGQDFKSSPSGNFIACSNGQKVYVYKNLGYEFECILALDSASITAYNVCQNAFIAINLQGIATVWDLINNTQTALSANFFGANKVDISSNLNFVLAHAGDFGYYYFRNTQTYEKFYKATQTYLYCPYFNIVTRFYSTQVLHYKVNDGYFSLITTAVNLYKNFDKDSFITSAYLLIASQKDVVSVFDYTGKMAVIAGGGYQILAISANAKYFIVKFNNGAIRAFLLNKKNMVFTQMKCAVPLASGEYFFVGSNHLICVTNSGAHLYEIINQFSEIVFDAANQTLQVNTQESYQDLQDRGFNITA